MNITLYIRSYRLDPDPFLLCVRHNNFEQWHLPSTWKNNVCFSLKFYLCGNIYLIIFFLLFFTLTLSPPLSLSLSLISLSVVLSMSIYISYHFNYISVSFHFNSVVSIDTLFLFICIPIENFHSECKFGNNWIQSNLFIPRTQTIQLWVWEDILNLKICFLQLWLRIVSTVYNMAVSVIQ